jgi:hypothetical protein
VSHTRDLVIAACLVAGARAQQCAVYPRPGRRSDDGRIQDGDSGDLSRREDLAMSTEQVLSNQKTMLFNQATIIKNQAEMKHNQDEIKTNQKLILDNQEKMLANQEKMLAKK